MVNLESTSRDAQADLQVRSLEATCFSLRTFISVAVGMAFFWQFFRHANLANLFDLSAVGAVPEIEMWVPVYYGALLLIAVAALFPAVVRRLETKSAVTLVSVLASASSGLLLVLKVFVDRDSDLLYVVSLLAAIAFAVSFVALTLSWASCCKTLAGLDAKGVVYCLCVSSLVSLVVSFGLFSLSPIPEVFPAIVPLASAVPLLYVRSSIAGELQNGSRPVGPRRELPSRRMAAPRGLVVVLVILLVIAVCVKGLYDTLVVNGFETGLYLKHFITIVELAGIMAICLLSVRMERVAFLGWFVLAGGLVSGLVMISLSDSDLFLQVGLGTITAARTCFEVFVFSLVAAAMGKSPLSRTMLLLLVIPEAASCLFGYFAIPTALLAAGFTVLPTVGFISLGLGVAVAVCSFFVASFLALKGIDATADVSKRDSVIGATEARSEARLDCIASEYGLTPREREIAEYVFRGYSAKRIAELQYLSLNTVQSHTKNLYRKIGIHSRQDLIDLVDEGVDEIA